MTSILTSARSKIVGGTTDPDPGVVTLSAGQRAAVGAFVSGGAPFCTGTLIAPRVVLTAAHCEVSAGAVFVLGDDTTAPAASATVRAVTVHPGYSPGLRSLGLGLTANPSAYDHALVLLDRDLPAEPLAVGSGPAPMELVQCVGFGRVDPEERGNTRKWWVVEEVASVREASFVVNGGGRYGLCAGDSGGPALAMRGGAATIIGTVSRGEESCTGRDEFSRTDVDAVWIAQATTDLSKIPQAVQRARWTVPVILLAGLGVLWLSRKRR